jgi:hypothetical protein
VTLLIAVLPIALPSAGAADAALPPTPIAAAVNTINTTLRIDNLLCFVSAPTRTFVCELGCIKENRFKFSRVCMNGRSVCARCAAVGRVVAML